MALGIVRSHESLVARFLLLDSGFLLQNCFVLVSANYPGFNQTDRKFYGTISVGRSKDDAVDRHGSQNSLTKTKLTASLVSH